MAARRWEAVPVVVQDPLWEQSFPAISSVVVPLADPETGAVSEVRLSRREAKARRVDNERRRATLLAGFARLGLDSAMIVYFMMELEEKLELELSPDDFYDHPTVNDLSRYLAQRQATRSAAVLERRYAGRPGVSRSVHNVSSVTPSVV